MNIDFVGRSIYYITDTELGSTIQENEYGYLLPTIRPAAATVLTVMTRCPTVKSVASIQAGPAATSTGPLCEAVDTACYDGKGLYTA